MSLANDRSTRAYEQEADETRRRLSTSLDELATSLTPGRMLDEVLSYARAGGADFLRGLGNAASANPMPTLLIGLGAAMFLTGKGRVDGHGATGANGHGADVLRHAAGAMRHRTGADFGDRHASEGRRGGSVAGLATGAASATASVAAGIGAAASNATGVVGSAVTSAAEAVGSAASSAAGTVGDAAGALRDKTTAGLAAAGDLASTAGGFVADAAGTVADGARAVTDSAGQFAGSARDAVAEQGQRLFDQTARLTRDLTNQANRLVREQPLAVAAAGLAVGAAVAAMLPRTRMEDSLLGESSDAVKDTVAGAAGEQFQRATDATGRIVDEVKHVAEREGLSAAAAVDAIRDMGEKVKRVVVAAGAANADGDEKTDGGPEPASHPAASGV